MKKSTVKFNATALEKQLLEKLTKEQTRRLIAYAKEKIQEIGDKIQTWNSRNHMDRTGNLLNSLCWGVSYGGEMVETGFYRDATSIRESGLHEWSGQNDEPVDGRARAEAFLQRKSKDCPKNKWRVFFAILAPYWGYWETGFVFVHGEGRGNFRGATFMKFSVMSQVYDTVSKELKPAETTFRIYRAPNANNSQNTPSHRWESFNEKRRTMRLNKYRNMKRPSKYRWRGQ